jgi:SnoaL-like domain
MTDEVSRLTSKEEVLDAVHDLFVGTDDRDWGRVRAVLAPRVLFDMKSLTGAEPSTVPAEDIVAGWDSGLAPLEAIHHQIGNARANVEGDEADVFCYGIAFHYRRNASGRNTRTFVGTYDLHLARIGGRWRIDRFRFHSKFVDGNLDLEKES